MGPNLQESSPNDSANRKSKFHGSSMNFIFDQKIRFCHADGHEVLTICYILSHLLYFFRNEFRCKKYSKIGYSSSGEFIGSSREREIVFYKHIRR